jgi:N,N-dimethylformamidase
MIPLAGYLDRISARPGETVGVKVSSQLAAPYDADLVRIVCADPNPDGPGMQLVPMPGALTGQYPSRVQPVRPGSCAVIGTPGLAMPEACTIVVRVQPGLVSAGARPVLAIGGMVLLAGPNGAALARDGSTVCNVSAPMRDRCWYELRAIFEGGTVRLSQTALQESWGVADSGEAEGQAASPSGEQVFIATDGAAFFDGRIEDPMLLSGIDDAEVLAFWDFSIGIPTQEITDRGPHGWHGTLRQLPTRGLRGSRWRNAEQCWRHAPRDYATIGFSSTALYDCGWATDFTWTVPGDLPSGVYGIRLRCGEALEIIPVWVLPPRGTVRAPVAFLASTFTYQAYINHVRGNFDAAFKARVAEWGAYPNNPDEHPEYGGSTYNRHPDGTGISLSSWRRPALTVRPGFLTFNDAGGSGLRHFPADSHLTAWLEATGQPFDVITDHDLHREGAALLDGYKCVLTGSHPEYHTPETLDALQAYVGGGGRLCYLGGNGFYWRIAVSDGVPDVLEVRRAEGGIRAWDAGPGEAYHQLDGGYGGLWRRNGRPPQALAGVGFSAQGLFEGSYYRLLPASRDPAVAWITEGVDGDIVGDYGLSGGGAAGFELDRADERLGTPSNAVIIARSEGHQPHFVAVPEELLSHVHTVTGERPSELVRAEIVYFETANSGAVFSTGSITFLGSLWRPGYDKLGYDNPVATMLGNVVQRFAHE